MEYVTQTGVVELEGRGHVAGEAMSFEAGKRKEKEHGERRWAENGAGGRQAMPSSSEAPCTIEGRWWHASRLLGDGYKWFIFFFSAYLS